MGGGVLTVLHFFTALSNKEEYIYMDTVGSHSGVRKRRRLFVPIFANNTQICFLTASKLFVFAMSCDAITVYFQIISTMMIVV
jgi:hypothetical protein